MAAYSQTELVDLCERLTKQRLDSWITEGWLPAPEVDAARSYSDIDRARADLICHLMDDLEIEASSMGVILSLMDQVYALRSELRGLAEAVAEQPTAVRARIVRARIRKQALPL